MSLNMNQFGQANVAGALDLTTNPNPAVLSARFDPTAGATVVRYGEGVRLVDLGVDDPNHGPPVVGLRTAATGAGSETFGVRIFTTKQAQAEAGDVIEVAFRGAVIWMKAHSALNRGVLVALDHDDAPGEVQAVGTLSAFGLTLDKASAEGDLIRVLVTADGTSQGA